MAKLNEAQVAVYKRYLKNWRYIHSELKKSYDFPSAGEALEFLAFVVRKAQELEYSPNLQLKGTRVSLHLATTDDEGTGVTGKDFAMAMAVERWVQDHSPNLKGTR